MGAQNWRVALLLRNNATSVEIVVLRIRDMASDWGSGVWTAAVRAPVVAAIFGLLSFPAARAEGSTCYTASVD